MAYWQTGVGVWHFPSMHMHRVSTNPKNPSSYAPNITGTSLNFSSIMQSYKMNPTLTCGLSTVSDSMYMVYDMCDVECIMWVISQ